MISAVAGYSLLGQPIAYPRAYLSGVIVLGTLSSFTDQYPLDGDAWRITVVEPVTLWVNIYAMDGHNYLARSRMLERVVSPYLWTSHKLVTLEERDFDPDTTLWAEDATWRIYAVVTFPGADNTVNVFDMPDMSSDYYAKALNPPFA